MITSACVKFFTVNGIEYNIPCHRHADAYFIISQFFSSKAIDKSKTLEGFLNDKDKFLTRYEAHEEAVRCNQIKTDDCYKELYSEDLW